MLEEGEDYYVERMVIPDPAGTYAYVNLPDGKVELTPVRDTRTELEKDIDKLIQQYREKENV